MPSGDFVIVLILVLAAEFVNGWTDAPNAIATVVSTRVLSPLKAVLMASVLNMAGVLLTGTAVATTIGKGIVRTNTINIEVVAAAMIAIVAWSGITWKLALPTSKSHELVAGLSGAALVTAGLGTLEWSGWQKVLIGLGFSTALGFTLSIVLMSGVYWSLRRTGTATTRRLFGRLQILSSGFMAFSHGSNDGQKFIGVFTLALVLQGTLGEFQVPLWVIVLCGVTMALGTSIGGWRILRTVGFRLTMLEPVHGFVAETSASMAILVASVSGIPLSTTHTINTSIMGVGASRRLSAVRWGVTRHIVMAWLLTFPACALMGGIFALLLKPLF
ncbi:MAG: inorganic phosphate transporter [Chloroflexi bacterium]|nr:inorganic phosphate transporter [Chloroflexota bacterium]